MKKSYYNPSQTRGLQFSGTIHLSDIFVLIGVTLLCKAILSMPEAIATIESQEVEINIINSKTIKL